MRKSELSVYEKYRALEYDVIKVGIPDLILLKGGQIEFIEVKMENNPQLSESQIRAIKLLKKHGIPVKVEVIELSPDWRNRRSHYTFPLNTPSHPGQKYPQFPTWLFEQSPTKSGG